MFGQSRRQAFLDAVAPPADEPDYEPGLRLVQQLLADSKKGAELVKKAVDATAAIKAAKVVVDELESAKSFSEEGIDKAKAEIAKLCAAHDKACKAREVELAVREKQTANLLAAAKADADKAAADRAEAKRRLAAVEAAVNG